MCGKRCVYTSNEECLGGKFRVGGDVGLIVDHVYTNACKARRHSYIVENLYIKHRVTEVSDDLYNLKSPSYTKHDVH